MTSRFSSSLARAFLLAACTAAVAATPVAAEAQAITTKCTPYQLTVSQARRPDSVAFAQHCRYEAASAQARAKVRADSLARVKAVIDSTRLANTKPKGYTGPCWRFNVAPVAPASGPIALRCYTTAEVRQMVQYGALSAKIGGVWKNEVAPGKNWLRMEDGSLEALTVAAP